MWITTEGGQPLITEDSGDILVTESQPSVPLPLQELIPAYPYLQYSDDPNICAFFTAYNILAKTYLDWFNQTPLAVYTLPSINGPLLDWIARGIYGMERPVFASFVNRYLAGLNSRPLNTRGINSPNHIQSGTATVATDDFYKRVLTWWFYLGDGRYFDVQWLRRRVARFIYGSNGADCSIAQVQTIHILAGLLANPRAPTLSYVAGGSLGSTTYAARTSYVTPKGETLAGPPSRLAVPANNLLVVDSPPAANGATGYNVYAAEVGPAPSHYLAGINSGAINSRAINGSNQPPIAWEKQTLSPIAIGTNWTEPPTGLIAGGPLPLSNTSNTATNIIITVPSGLAATYFQQAFNQGLLAFPFQLTGSVVIA